jgi:hypothetical protein
MSGLKVVLWRSLLVLAALIMLPGASVFAQAFSQSDIYSIIRGTPFYDPNASACTGTTVTAGTGAPDGAAFPNLDPTAMANAINTWIQQQNPNSELSGLGTTIVAGAQHSNVNPFLIVAIAREETSLADPSTYNVKYANNAFSREATPSQPNYPGAGPNAGTLWYKWSSVEASVDYTAPENQGAAGGGDIAAYLRDKYGSQIDNNDLLAFMEAYAPDKENNTAQYIADVQSWITDLVNLTTGSSDSSSPTNTANSTCNSSGGVNCQLNTTSSSAGSSSNLSSVRQEVVCIAEQELATWTSQPGYPWPCPSGKTECTNSYSETGYLQYSQNRQEEWCADFVSWVYDQAKYPLQPDPNWDLSGVAEIQAIGEQNQNFHWHPEASYVPKPGDLAVYTTDQPDGHINIVVSVSSDTMDAIGGDQGHGPYPGGSIVSEKAGVPIHGEGITGYVTPD